MSSVLSASVAAPEVRETAEIAGFDAARALEDVERLSFPRGVGSPGERRAARSILRSLTDAGLSCRREWFHLPDSAPGVGVRLILAACALAALLGGRVWVSRPLDAAACWVLAALFVNAPWRAGRGASPDRPGGRLRSSNLIGSLPDGPGAEAPARVVFMAHYDTKSQPLPTGVRVGLVIAVTGLCGLLAACGLAASFGLTTVPGGVGSGLALAASGMLILLALNSTGNRSPGALDNGTGVAALLELARTWRPRPEAPVEAFWVASGAEELGLFGGCALLRRHEAWWRQKPTLLVNLDTVGAGRRTFLAGEPSALRLAQETADDLGLAWSRLQVLGAGMDHEPFAASGLPAVSVLGDVVGSSLCLHTVLDTVARVDLAALARAGRLAAHIGWAWARQHQAGRTEGVNAAR